MKKTLFLILFGFTFFIIFNSTAAAHCEIPCGIYDDEARVAMLLEHTTTIEKSMREVKALENADPGNANQLIRWVMNKEHHANELQEIVTQYFMTQRVKTDAEKYEKKNHCPAPDADLQHESQTVNR
ncbi:MAG: superoxide dismutase [Ni] [Acidobacteriota bacterium]